MDSAKIIKPNEYDIFEDISGNEAYFYWCDKTELQKLFTIREDLEYLPCFPYESISYKDLIGKKLLMFFKQPKILYGITKIKSVIIQKQKITLYSDNENENEEDYDINKTNSVIVNKNLYDELTKKYNVSESCILFFIEIEHVKKFEYRFDIKNFNAYFQKRETLSNEYIDDVKYSDEFETDKTDKTNKSSGSNCSDIFSYPSKILPKYIVKSYVNENFGEKIIEYYTHLNSHACAEQAKNVNAEKICAKINFNIPIMWKCCDELRTYILDGNIKKKHIIYHWNKCEKCEKNDNNTKELEFGENDKNNKNNKKITIKRITDNNELFQNILDDYQRVKKYQYQITGADFDFEENKINIAHFSLQNDTDINTNKNPYSKCLFVLEK